MRNARLVRTLAMGVTALVIGTAYADTINVRVHGVESGSPRGVMGIDSGDRA